MVPRIALLFIFVFPLTLVSQVAENAVPWHPNLKLAWDDFKGKIPPAATESAVTANGISYAYSANLIHNEVFIDFEVTAFFYPDESWCRPKLCNDNLLAHEQLHFDITELFARKMRLRLEETTFSSNVKEEISKIYHEVLQDLDFFQTTYDFETNFSRNREMQLQWQQRIAKELSDTSQKTVSIEIPD